MSRERDERYRGFLLRTGNDGLITIIDAIGKPLSKGMKFAQRDAARVFVDQWLAKPKQEPVQK